MSLTVELTAIARAARASALAGEELVAVIPAEPAVGERVYLCSFRAEDGGTTWLALDNSGGAIDSRRRVRDAVSIAAMCEVAEEVAGGGKLDELRARLEAVRGRESDPPGLAGVDQAVLELGHAVGQAPRLASPAYLDELGAAARRLEEAMGELGRSPFAEAMKLAVDSVEELWRDVEAGYRGSLT